VHKAAARAAKAKPLPPKFFTAASGTAVRALADEVIPKDERSGSATEALVPEFIDFILDDPLAEARERESLQTRVRGGLAWLGRECRGRFGKDFASCAPGERKAVLDDVAWPEKARPEMVPGRRSSRSSATLWPPASGRARWASRTCSTRATPSVAEWKGCPPEVLVKIGVVEVTGD